MTTTDEHQEHQALIDQPPPRVAVEWRSAPGDIEVRFADRTIELLAVPYNEETLVEYPRGSGRLIAEEIDPGTFIGQETRRVRGNRDHDVTRSFGKATSIRPTDERGLVVELRVAPTPIGDETLELANEGVLDPSVGMAVRPSDQRWSQGKSHRRVMRAFLDHIALCANPAYLGAGVLAVRHDEIRPSGIAVATAPLSTPNLDQVTMWLDGQRRQGA